MLLGNCKVNYTSLVSCIGRLLKNIYVKLNAVSKLLERMIHFTVSNFAGSKNGEVLSVEDGRD